MTSQPIGEREVRATTYVEVEMAQRTKTVAAGAAVLLALGVLASCGGGRRGAHVDRGGDTEGVCLVACVGGEYAVRRTVRVAGRPVRFAVGLSAPRQRLPRWRPRPGPWSSRPPGCCTRRRGGSTTTASCPRRTARSSRRARAHQLLRSAPLAPATLDEQAAAAIAVRYREKLTRLPDVVLDGEPAYRLSGRCSGDPCEYVGTQHSRRDIVLGFTLPTEGSVRRPVPRWSTR